MSLEMILVGRRTAAVGLPLAPDSAIPDWIALLDILHFTRAEPLERPTPPSAGDGQAGQAPAS